MALKFSMFSQIKPLAEEQFQFSADTPIQSLRQDLLGRGDFCCALAKVLVSWRSASSLVVALRGGWGEGKSSIKNLTIEQIASTSRKTKIVEFNPWRYGDSQAITEAFYREISASLGESDKSLAGRQRAWAFQNYGRILTGASSGLKIASEHVGGIVGWVAGIGFMTAGITAFISLVSLGKIAPYLLLAVGVLSLAGNILRALSGVDKLSKPLELVRADLEAKLKRMDQPVIVVVDDIDRLEADQIRTVFRHVKANADLPGLTYLLLFQANVVEAALNEVANNDGRGYLEKIIQSSFDIPAVERERVHQALFGALDRIMESDLILSNGFEDRRWGNLFYGGLNVYFRNLRDVHRYIASTSVHISLHRGAKVLEVNVIDFLGLEAIRLFEPEIFSAIAENKAIFTSLRDERLGISDKIQSIIALSSRGRQEYLSDLLRNLFPTIDWAFQGGTSYSSDSVVEWQSKRRICTDAFFDRYFNLRIPDQTVSESELVEFLENSGDRDAIAAHFKDLVERDLLRAMLTRLDDARDRIPIENSRAFLPELMDVARYFTADEVLNFNGPWTLTWRIALWLLQRNPDMAERGAILLDALEKTNDLKIAETIISIDEDRRNKPGEKPPIFAEADFTRAKALWVLRLKGWLSDVDRALAHPTLIPLLYAWQRWGETSESSDWMMACATQPRLFIATLRAFRSISTSQVFGEHVSQIHRRLNTKALADFLDFYQAQDLAKSLDRSILSKDDDELVQTLLTNSKPTSAEESDYL